jgi:hypothetical protein
MAVMPQFDSILIRLGLTNTTEHCSIKNDRALFHRSPKHVTYETEEQIVTLTDRILIDYTCT